MIVTLVVPDPPPTRASAGRSADRESPNAIALARAGEAVVRANPAAFPRTFNDIAVSFGKTLPDPAGYNAEDAIYEVLEDVGLLTDPESFSMSRSQDASADFYVITLTLDDP
jgi:hypothetical protein